jgi:hypothetical protein
MRLILVPASSMPEVERHAIKAVGGGQKLDTIFKKRCRTPRLFGARTRRNSCDEPHFLVELHEKVVRAVFPRQRGFGVSVHIDGKRQTAKRYAAHQSNICAQLPHNVYEQPPPPPGADVNYI